MNCSVNECQNKVKVHTRKLCAAHYQRYLRQGDNFDKSLIKDVHKTINQRISESFSINETGCHEWNKALTACGYGVIGVGSRLDNTKRIVLAHRVSYEIHKGLIPKGINVLHKCDNRRCINPEHLFLGTAKDNTQDMYNKGREAIKKGVVPVNFIEQIEKVKSRKFSKLSIKQVKEIKKLLILGMHYKLIANEYNVSLSCISDIKRKATWIDI